MSPVRVGVVLPQFRSDPREAINAARRAEAAGLDSVWLFDHIWPPQPSGATGRIEVERRRRTPTLEAWTMLAYLASVTERISLGTLVTRSSLRSPGLLAKMAETVVAVAPQRVIVGIGSGDASSRAENAAVGAPFWDGRKRLDQLAATVRVLRPWLAGEPVPHADAYVSVRGASGRVLPPPPVWIGGASRRSARLAGAVADGYNAWGLPPRAFAERVREARAAAGGRGFELSWGGTVLVAAAARGARGRGPPERPDAAGSPEQVGRALAEYVRRGATHLIVIPARGSDADAVMQLGGPVRARLQEAL